MFAKIKSKFLRQEEGAVTVDWVVLSAAVIGLTMLVIAPIIVGTESMNQKAVGYVEGVEVGYAGN